MTLQKLRLIAIKFNQSPVLLFGLLFVFAFAIRLHGISAPLWLDEIVGYRLAQLGPAAILRNSFSDPYPPLYYFFQWLVSGFGSSRSEAVWHLLPALCGALTIPVIWITARQIVGVYPALLSALVAATSQILLYFSQEARPYALLILISAVSTWVIFKILQNPVDHKLLSYWVILTWLGIYSGYSYLLIAGVQFLVLAGIYRFQRAWLVNACIFILGGLLLAPFAVSSLGKFSNLHTHATGQWLNFWFTIQSLAYGDQLRYGSSRIYLVMPILFCGLCFLGFVILRRQAMKFSAYLALQIIIPLALFFGILEPVLKIRLPMFEVKHFVVLLPQLYLLMAAGFAGMARILSRSRVLRVLVPLAVCVAMLGMNSLGLRRYWNTPKSPEAAAVKDTLHKLRPGDQIVSLHYSPTYALGFYSGSVPVYVDPVNTGNQFSYKRVEGSSLFVQEVEGKAEVETAQIRKNGRFWVFAHSDVLRESLDSLIQGCALTSDGKYAPFVVIHVESCPD